MSKEADKTGHLQDDESPMEELIIGNAVYKTKLTSKFINRARWIRPDERKVHAVIPGAIRKVMVKEGEEVDPGAPMLVLEAMKMENLVLSPMQGIVKKIHISAGDQVAKSQLLIEFT